MLRRRRKKMSRFSPSGIKGLTWIESNWRIVGFWKRRRRKQVSLFSAYSSPSRYIPVSSWHLLAKPTTTMEKKKCEISKTNIKSSSRKIPSRLFFFGLYWLYVNSTMRGQWRRCFRSVKQFVRITRLISSRHPHLVLFIPSILTRSDTLNTWEIIGFQRRRKDILSIESPLSLMTCWYYALNCIPSIIKRSNEIDLAYIYSTGTILMTFCWQWKMSIIKSGSAVRIKLQNVCLAWLYKKILIKMGGGSSFMDKQYTIYGEGVGDVIPKR